MRTIVDLPGEQLEALARICRRRHISRAEAVRRAVEHFIAGEHVDEADDAFGIWRGREDGLEYQGRLRSEWER